ncbi:MAG TPA: c-type cytochrome [Candidatus Krumholzibacteria bacterium]|nr:c-type cytochrome [Candidatus Krumholzibacteria bacterium]
MPLARRTAFLVLAVLLATPVAFVHAQIPDKFTNLKVLPQDIQKPQLVATMRGFSMALGVRCDHCHVENEATHEHDWASDAKDTKKIAREMMKLSGEVNASLKTRVGSMRPDLIQVRCVTCHHGLPKPQTLEQVLDASLAISGTDSTVAKYHRLRDEYYGAAAYDFSEWSLISIAENMAKADPAKADAALALLNTNLQYFPESAGTYARIAETYLVKGDKATAIQNFDKAVALAPEDPWLKRRVESVKSGQ